MEMHEIAGGIDMGSWICSGCLRVVHIIIEPGKSKGEVKEIEVASDWTSGIQYCPFCGEAMEKDTL